MQKKILAVLVATSLCALAQSRGQLVQTKDAVRVRLPDKGGHWTVQFKAYTPPHTTAASAAAKPASGPVPFGLSSVDVISTKEVRRDRLQWTDGKFSDAWRIKGEWFMTNENNDVMSMDTLHGAQLFVGWEKFDSNQLQQIARSGTGTLTAYRNMPVIYYGSETTSAVRTESFLTSLDGILAAGKAPAAASTKTTLGLFVDPQTLYPIIYRDHLGDYYFSNIGEGPLSLTVPPKVMFIAKKSQDMRYAPPAPTHP